MRIKLTVLMISLVLVFVGSFAAFAEEKRDINKATVEELIAVHGIGEKKARAIYEYIKSVNGVKDMDELLNVMGIGKKTLTELKKTFEVKEGAK